MMIRLAKGPKHGSRPLVASSSPRSIPPAISTLSLSLPQVPSPHPRLFPAPTVLTRTASGRFTASPQFPIPKRSPARRNPNPSRRRCRRAMAAAECRDEVGLEERLIDDRGSRDLEEEEHGVPRRPRPHPPRSRLESPSCDGSPTPGVLESCRSVQCRSTTRLDGA